MGLSISLQNEIGEPLAVILDDRNLLHKVLPGPDDESHPMLGSIDWYGDTVFNRVQMSPFLREWQNITRNLQSPAEREMADQIKELAERCRDGVHLYVKFIGD